MKISLKVKRNKFSLLCH